MSINIAINGFGRIGRATLRAWIERGRRDITITAVNDLAPHATNMHLLKYDSVHGRFPHPVSLNENKLTIGSHAITLTQEKDPANLPWKNHGIDIVLECTGAFTKKEKAAAHLAAGAKKVIISAPADSADATIVYGVNHTALTNAHTVISNASCTTNCLAPIAHVLHQAVGIEQGLMTTIHSYTNDQRVLDLAHDDPHRARAAALNMIPTKTGAAKAVGLVLPELNGKLDGLAIRVPTPNVSLVDFTFTPARPTSVDEINNALTAASQSPALKNILATSTEPLVSSDYNHTLASATADITQTRVSANGKLVKVLAWYDNEWAFSNRLLDVAAYLGNLK